MSQPTAFHIWLKTGHDWSSEAFSAAAQERDVGVSDGRLFALEHSASDSAVRICICAAQGEAELREALSGRWSAGWCSKQWLAEFRHKKSPASRAFSVFEGCA